MKLPTPRARRKAGYRLVKVGEQLLPSDEVLFDGPLGKIKAGWHTMASLGDQKLGLVQDPLLDNSGAFPYGFYRRKVE